jgi:uroporphyrinogen III methyltransferase/synthase
VTVFLVGAGPGDPGLLTLRGAEVLRRADVVVHDRLAEGSLLDLAPDGAERIDVGKSPGGPVHQDAINDLLVARGRGGGTVVRLKGGDPFVFGRGGEEAAALEAAGVAFEVVPGVTSAVAVPAYAGVPVTHRGLATSFTVVTGHSRHAVDVETNWEALATVGGTIVVLMGVAQRAVIAARLLAGGLPADTPVAAVTWGSRPQQHTVRTTLADLGAASLQPPATIVIGAVAGLDLGWYERRPLFGRSVVVTRARAQASDLVGRLRALGAATVELAAIRIVDPADGGAGLARGAEGIRSGRYDWVVFTSANAVSRLCDLLPDSRVWGATRIAAIGPGTAAALAGYRLPADLLPGRFVAEGLLEVFPSAPAGRRMGADDGRAGADDSRVGANDRLRGAGDGRAGADDGGATVLLPRAAVARDVLPEGLAAAGWTVDVVEAYRTERAEVPADVLAGAASADAICFTSSSTVTNYLDLAGAGHVPAVVACIGPITAATARAAGLTVTVEATEHTIGGLVDALVATLAPGSAR